MRLVLTLLLRRLILWILRYYDFLNLAGGNCQRYLFDELLAQQSEFLFRFTYIKIMGIRKWLQEVTAPGVLDDATREFLHPQLKSLATTLEQKHCKQIPQLDIDHSMIEVSRICKIIFFQECILTFLSFYVRKVPVAEHFYVSTDPLLNKVLVKYLITLAYDSYKSDTIFSLKICYRLPYNNNLELCFCFLYH